MQAHDEAQGEHRKVLDAALRWISLKIDGHDDQTGDHQEVEDIKQRRIREKPDRVNNGIYSHGRLLLGYLTGTLVWARGSIRHNRNNRFSVHTLE
jgi:hypothetical protein